MHTVYAFQLVPTFVHLLLLNQMKELTDVGYMYLQQQTQYTNHTRK